MGHKDHSGSREARNTVVLVADVGGMEHYHVGDEAILTSNLAWWRAEFPDVAPVVLSEAPAFTGTLHGVKALREPRLPAWCGNRGFLELLRRCPGALLRLHLPLLRRRFPDAAQALAELGRARVLHICGGGNLTSDYAALLRLRSFLAVAATALGVPVVVTGQQVGPRLRRADARGLRTWLPRASLVGVRDTGSAGECRALGVAAGKVQVTGDDAMVLEGGLPPDSFDPPHGPLVGLCLHHHGSREDREASVERLAAALGPWLQTVEASLMLIPHVRSEVAHRCDVRFGRDVLQRCDAGLRTRLVECPAWRDIHVKAVTARCDFLVTTRFHGAVFGLSSGVPAFTLAQNDYTREKFRGLWDYFGLPAEGGSMGEEGHLPDRLRAAWQRRGEQRAALAKAGERVRANFARTRAELRSNVGAYISGLRVSGRVC